jgi:hypothetical protein
VFRLRLEGEKLLAELVDESVRQRFEDVRVDSIWSGGRGRFASRLSSTPEHIGRVNGGRKSSALVDRRG